MEDATEAGADNEGDMPELRGDDDLTNFEESNPNDRFLEEPPYEYIKDAWDADF